MIKLTITTKSGTTVSLDIPDHDDVVFQQAVEEVRVPEPVREEVVASTSVDEVLAMVEEENMTVVEQFNEPEPAPFDYEASIDTSLDAFQFPLENGTMYCPPMPLVRDFILAFGKDHVQREFLKARSWLTANVDKRKTGRGMGRFLNSWLCREAGMKRTPIKAIVPKSDSLLSNGNTTSEGW